MPNAPERIFRNARVWIGDARGARWEAFSVASGRFLAIGPEQDILASKRPATEIVDLEGGVVVPGFHDAHLHLSCGALAGHAIDLRLAGSVEEAAAKVGEKASRSPANAGWLRGWGWDQSRWPGGEWPDRSSLDRVAPARPILLARIDGHAAWLNGEALRVLGIDRASRDPDGGVIRKDPRTGEPTGVLLERAAEMAIAALPLPSDGERRAAVEESLALLAKHGITAVEDVSEPWAVAVFGSLQEEGRLNARVAVWLPFDTDRADAEEIRRRYPPGDSFLVVGTLKLFLDGTLGSRSAALEQDYEDAPGERGILRVDPPDLAERVATADRAGWTIAIHAIGDRAVRVALDVFGGLEPRARRVPHRIEHAQVVSPEDFPRFAAGGIVASVQPVHLLEDAAWVSSRLGAPRAARAYPWRSLIRSGSVLAIGTDWPVASIDPLEGIHAASCFRKERIDLGPEQSLTPREVILAYTVGSAAARGAADSLGRLAPGYHADFVVLSRDPCSIPTREIRDGVRILATYVAGRRVWPETEIPGDLRSPGSTSV